jgi:hypothetical protein
MWFTDAVDVPDEVVDALTNGRLVVFVGAGASVAPPSSLPLFDALASHVAEQAYRPSYDPSAYGGETPDGFLGRLEQEGVAVRELVHERLSRTDSRPCALHRAIVRMFASANRIRIITTNFDPHLSTAAAEEYPEPTQTYCAPAIPLGDDFTGIVNLHGCLDGRLQDLVVTSKDFGHAYLTNPWAAGFLRDVFTNYVTLFVGYNHNDVVMKYLALGLQPSSRRFGFLPAGDTTAEMWDQLGIHRIDYPAGSDHGELTETIRRWGDWERMDLLAHESRLRLTVSQGPPVNPSDVSYLERAVAHDTQSRFFAEHATGVEWLDWVNQREPFPRLFQVAQALEPAAFAIGIWFADMAVAHPGRAIRAIESNGGQLNSGPARRIAWLLQKPDLDRKLVGRWVGVLVQSGDPLVDSGLSDLLRTMRWPEDRETALALFEYLSRPLVRLRPTFRFDGEQLEETTDFGVDSLVGDQAALTEAWTGYYRPRLGDLVDPLVRIFEHHLATMHRRLRMVAQANDRWDSISFLRAGIEPNPQDGLSGPPHLLIDGARDCLEHLLGEEPEAGAAVIDRWERADIPLLRRLAVHGWTERSDRAADEKITHVIDSGLLFAFATKHETYRLLEKSLPDALGVHDRLLGVILAGPPPHEPGGSGVNDQLVLDLLAKIAEVVPGVAVFADAFAAFQAAHPVIAPSTHLGSDRWVEAGFRLPDLVSVDQVLGCKSMAEVDELLTEAVTSDPMAAALSGPFLLGTTASAAAQDPGWAVQRLQELKAQRSWTAPYWEPLVTGLARSAHEMGEDRVTEVLALLIEVLGEIEDQSELGGLFSPISELLLSIARIPHPSPSILDAAEGLALGVSERVALGPDFPAEIEAERVLDDAYNWWTGRLARFWVGAIAKRWALVGDSWSGLSLTEKSGLEALLDAPEPKDVLPRAVLAENLTLLLGADAQWALVHVVSDFDWQSDSVTERAWSGFIGGRTWDERTASLLKESLKAAFSKLRGRAGKQLAESFGEVVVQSSSDYRADGTLGEFVVDADEGMRIAFAESVGWWLHQMTPAYAEGVWQAWALDYLDDRLGKKPLPLTPAEAAGLLRWITTAGDRFPAVVERYLKTPARFTAVSLFYRDIDDASLPERYPEAMAQLLAFVVARSDVLYTCDMVGGLVGSLTAALTANHRTLLLGICESSLALGCSEAVIWKATIEAKWPEDGPASE